MPSSWYRSGSFTYADGRCFFGPADPPPGTRTRLEFQCGIIAVGLPSGVRADAIREVVSATRGSILRDHSGGEFGALVIRVPERTEGAALLRILDDDRVRYASLNWVMGTQG